MQQAAELGLVNANDPLVNEYRYTPFGAPANGYPVEGTTNPLQYMARELDAATGLFHVRNRWYDPQLGRFISRGPHRAGRGDQPVCLHRQQSDELPRSARAEAMSWGAMGAVAGFYRCL